MKNHIRKGRKENRYRKWKEEREQLIGKEQTKEEKYPANLM